MSGLRFESMADMPPRMRELYARRKLDLSGAAAPAPLRKGSRGNTKYNNINKNLRELRNMCIYLPEYWERLKDLQRKIDRPMKGYYKGKPRGVFELEQRFRAELEQEARA